MGLILIDPVLYGTHPKGTYPVANKRSVSYASTFRRDVWPSRKEAAASFAKSPYYQKWDQRVFERWLKFGLRDLPTALYPDERTDSTKTMPVTLVTTKHQEAWTFLRPSYVYKPDSEGKQPAPNKITHPDLDPSSTDSYPFYRPEPISTFLKLKYLRPPVLYVFGETSELSSVEVRKDKMEETGTGVGGSGGAAEGRVKEIVLPNVGHLIPMEAVDAAAEASVQWLRQELRRWQEVEDDWVRLQNTRGKLDTIMVNDGWIVNIGGPPQKKLSSAKL